MKHGQDQIDFVAPGGRSIGTTSLENQYLVVNGPCLGGFTGTSAATPMVTGVASLILGLNPSLVGEDAREIMKLTADVAVGSNPTGFDNDTGWGLIDAEAAVDFVIANQFQFGEESGLSTHAVVATDVTYEGLPTGNGSDWPSGKYFVDRHELRKTVTFGSAFTSTPEVWGKSFGSLGWEDDSQTYKSIWSEPDGYAEVVPGSITATGFTVRTYVYWVKTNVIGSPVQQWHPTAPANALASWTAAGPLSTVGVGDDSSNLRFTTRLFANPAKGTANLLVSISEPTQMKVEVYDVAGRRVRLLSEGEFSSGVHALNWDGDSDAGRLVSAGIYFYRISTPEGKRVERFLFQR